MDDDDEYCSDKTPLLLGVSSDAHQDFNSCSNRVASPADHLILPYRDVVSIFVVAFDTRAGNIIEWSQPSDCPLDGLEFKAMPSGSHCVRTDFIYFKRDTLFGLACFENMPVDCVEERGARMKSVGVLATTYTHLYKHQEFLQTQVKKLLRSPGNYHDLLTFYEEKKGILLAAEPVSQNSLGFPFMHITHPAGCFSQFMNFFGAKVFVLWKSALLKRRIIFFSPPPIGIACYRVYCTTCLVRHTSELADPKIAQPLFYVNIADIEVLEEQVSYVACTTEKILESKFHLYDIYIDNQNLVSTSCERTKPPLTVNGADRAKYDQLLNFQSADSEREARFMQYFVSLNNRLFGTMFEVSRSLEKTWTSEHTKRLDLHPVEDANFIQELIETYGFNIEFSSQCCAW